jgi:acyl dehydratase
MSSETETQDDADEEIAGRNPAIGSLEDANNWIGRTGDTHYAVEPVTGSLIRFYTSMLEDGNPTYWDREWAEDQWGGICAPPGMMLTLQSRNLWSPGEEDADRESVSVASVPLPEQFDSIINTQTETIVHDQIKVGTWLNWETEVVDVSEEKETALGPGHFVTTKTYLRNESGELLAEDINSMLRYNDGSDGEDDGGELSYDTPFAEGRRRVDVGDSTRPDDRYTSIGIDEASEGEVAHTYEFPVTYRKVIHDVAATRDFYPVHHDPEFARSSGTETIFLNTMALQGLVDRAALEWAGPEWRVAERTIRMAGSALAGEVLTVEATVENISPADERITLEVAIDQNEQDICPSSVTIQRG